MAIKNIDQKDSQKFSLKMKKHQTKCQNKFLEGLNFKGGYFKGFDWKCQHTRRAHLDDKEHEKLKNKLEKVSNHYNI